MRRENLERHLCSRPRLSVSQVLPRPSSKRSAEHRNEGTHAVVADRDGHIRHWLVLCKPFKRREQSRLLAPTTKRHLHLGRKGAHECAPAHPGRLGPFIQGPIVGDILEQGPSHLCQPLMLRYGQPQKLLLGTLNLVPKDCKHPLLRVGDRLRWAPGKDAIYNRGSLGSPRHST